MKDWEGGRGKDGWMDRDGKEPASEMKERKKDE